MTYQIPIHAPAHQVLTKRNSAYIRLDFVNGRHVPTAVVSYDAEIIPQFHGKSLVEPSR